MYGASGMFLNASFPDHETLTATRTEMVAAGRLPPLPPLEEEEEEEGVWTEGEDGRCRRVQVRESGWKWKGGVVPSLLTPQAIKRENWMEREGRGRLFTTPVRLTPLPIKTLIRAPRQPDGTVRTVDCAALSPKEKASKRPSFSSSSVGSSSSSSKEKVTVDTTCVYRGGVDWTIYSVYKIDCGCLLPPAVADGKTHRVRLTNAKGKVQVAGVVIW